MTLDEYLNRPGNTAAALAEKARTSAPTISRILYGEQKPSSDMIRAIVEATNGSVTADDLVFGAPRAKPERAA
jgi:transcriptional regulator with XRE-family HTH domain